jgi:MFS family permease
MATASLLGALAIPAREIDHDLARGLHDELPAGGARDHDRKGPTNLAVLVTCRPLMIFAACVLLFHLANAAMLPLVGEKLALQDTTLATTLMSACIVAAQVVMVPMALLVGAKADSWGRKPLFLAGLAILPIRGVLYTLSDNAFWLVGVQLLDGIGAGIFGAIFPVIVADLMRGTGRFNAAQGAILTAQGIGAALSTTLAGVVVVHAGYSAAFLTLAAVAAVGFVVFIVAMPETQAQEEPAQLEGAALAAARRVEAE